MIYNMNYITFLSKENIFSFVQMYLLYCNTIITFLDIF